MIARYGSAAIVLVGGAGLIVGAALGLLLAPKSGAALRADLMSLWNRGTALAAEELHRAKEAMENEGGMAHVATPAGSPRQAHPHS